MFRLLFIVVFGLYGLGAMGVLDGRMEQVSLNHISNFVTSTTKQVAQNLGEGASNVAAKAAPSTSGRFTDRVVAKNKSLDNHKTERTADGSRIIRAY